MVLCGVRGFYCLTQPPTQLQYVRFGTVWGNAQTSESALSQDRDFWYDATNYILYVYSAGGNPASHYSTVAPIVLSGGSVLNLNTASWLEKDDLRRNVYDRIVIAGITFALTFAISALIAWRSYLGLR